MSLPIPDALAETCRAQPEHAAWLAQLPDRVAELARRWRLTLGAPYGGGTCAWVAPAMRADGTEVVMKLALPHMEGQDEAAGLRFWNGDGAVRLLDADPRLDALLLERCVPGTSLRERPEGEQDRVVASLLRRLWRVPPDPSPFRPLAEMLLYWGAETERQAAVWPDAGLVREGLRLFAELSRPAPTDVVLTTDLHAGNVLQAERELWLAIDPKPFVGDPAYDATQHLLNGRPRLHADPFGAIGRFADLLGVDAEQVRLWLFARAAAEGRDDGDDGLFRLARRLAP